MVLAENDSIIGLGANDGTLRVWKNNNSETLKDSERIQVGN